ncbi:5-formyltetrahydrofolate cyclo-ligase [uncultured Pseudodesulfovibrio sp.]|uniref:5-formyltetrahydrofolate cyclo-ligase n=1 Tax=uncultured Pseudodesulfovibrio sp. TaxID=2035858 RepID=UPI0029C90765|nr:5-formyltetrahydrofolate cyclo-ligase [uncultured Pseudodesulfovibrio sp.]
MQQDEKKKLRETLLKRRTALTKEQVRDGSQGAVELIRTLTEWKNACEVLIYWPIRGEVDVRPLSMELWQRGCRVLMPRCRPDAYGQMDIACAACEDDLTPGAFSIMEPDADKCPAVASCQPDIAIIPAICFDRRGYRLGYGGGYYDRLLTTDDMKDTLRIGLGYNFQLVEQLPTQPWDMPVDIVCTDEELWRP